MNTHRFPILMLACLLLTQVPVALAGDPFVDAVQRRADQIIAEINDGESAQEAYEESILLADFVAGNASRRQLESIVHAESTLRILERALMQRGSSRDRDALMTQTILPLIDTPRFRTQLALLIHERDDLAGVFKLAGQLATDRKDQVEQFPALGAALCVVHDSEFTRRINENNPSAPDPIEIFDYFVSNNAKMSNDLSTLPAPLLMHVVDVTESIDQLEWALKTYGNRPEVGDRFFEIEYDTDHFRRGSPKKVTQAGNYRLQSIKQHGGVCADQAYFAESIAKACGIPSCYVVARGADVSHAWVGFLDARGRARAWNFDAGRYESYQNLRGMVVNPQTRQTVADGEIGVLAGLVKDSESEFLVTLATGIAVQRMGRDGWAAPDAYELETTKGIMNSPRSGSIEDRLAFLKLALARCSSVPTTWGSIAALAEDGQLDMRALDSWSRSLFAITGNSFPDFTFEIVSKMISAEKDPQRQTKMWEWAFSKYRTRPDLASNVRMEQGRLMEQAGKPELAWAAYESIVQNFLNDGPMCVDALRAMERLLESEGKRGAILPYLRDASQKVRRPGDMSPQFASQSNYFKIKMMYATELRESGKSTQADQILNELGINQKP